MLRLRVITALVLLAILLPALFAASPWPFALFTTCFVIAAAWEWGRLSGLGPAGSLLCAAWQAVICAWALAMGWAWTEPSIFWLLPALLWIMVGFRALSSGPAGWTRIRVPLKLLLGAAVLAAAWLAFVQARVVGINFLLSVVTIVWAADISAYFAGRQWGRRKLAVTISPGKTWEGVGGALVGVVLLSLLWQWAEARWPVDSPSIHALLHERMGVVGSWVSLAVLVACSVMGDLIESLIKRAAGVKDSSSLLPGHGGVLDRIDALLPVMPVAMALLVLKAL